MKDKIENKVWLGKDGILYIKMIKSTNEEDTFEVLRKMEEILKKSPPKTKILVSVLVSSVIKSSHFRKKCGEKIKELSEKVPLGKTAIVGLTVIPRTIARFIIMASGVENIEIFDGEKEALKWLKEP